LGQPCCAACSSSWAVRQRWLIRERVIEGEIKRYPWLMVLGGRVQEVCALGVCQSGSCDEVGTTGTQTEVRDREPLRRAPGSLVEQAGVIRSRTAAIETSNAS
jgi:hypothetical protein